jgi:large subunit ribosomal protein L15
MVIYKRRKSKRLRGSKTYGWGAMKKHRGSGNKGGAGNAGSGKRADSKKPSTWAEEDHFGKHGFVPKTGIVFRAINASDIEQKMPHLLKEGKAVHEAGAYKIDLATLGFNKLLSSGRISTKMIITVQYASEGAIAKVEEAGGKVEGLLPKKDKKKKDDKNAKKGKDAQEADN